MHTNCACACLYPETGYIIRGSLHTSQNSHLLLYPLLWLLVHGLSSLFLPLFPIQPAFDISTGQKYLWEMAKRLYKLQEPLIVYSCKILSKLSIYDYVTFSNLLVFSQQTHEVSAKTLFEWLTGKRHRRHLPRRLFELEVKMSHGKL